jgi:hypothetical protein
LTRRFKYKVSSIGGASVEIKEHSWMTETS